MKENKLQLKSSKLETTYASQNYVTPTNNNIKTSSVTIQYLVRKGVLGRLFCRGEMVSYSVEVKKGFPTIQHISIS
jgi:hypothetical protein